MHEPKIIDEEEMLSMFGACVVHFEKHYKHTFTYSGKFADGKYLVCECGGSPDAIYRHLVVCGETYEIRRLSPYRVALMEGDAVLIEYADYG